MITRYPKQPDEVLDYMFDFSSWMAAGDYITSSTVTADAGLTLGAKTNEPALNPNVVRQFMSGGTDKTAYRVKCSITTSGNRTKNAILILQVNAL